MGRLQDYRCIIFGVYLVIYKSSLCNYFVRNRNTMLFDNFIDSGGSAMFQNRAKTIHSLIKITIDIVPI